MPQGWSCSDSMNSKRPLFKAFHSALCFSSMGDRLDSPNKYHLCLRLQMCTCMHTQTVSRALRLTWVESGTINRSVQRNLVPRWWDFFLVTVDHKSQKHTIILCLGSRVSAGTQCCLFPCILCRAPQSSGRQSVFKLHRNLKDSQTDIFS